jgi:hypothetical protein
MTDELRDRVGDAPDFDEDESPLEPPAPPRAPSQVYSLRIPVDKLELLRQIAAEHNELPSALMRRWILERLETAAPDGPNQGGYSLAGDLVDRVIDLEQQVARHQKELEQKASQHQKELETVVDQVIGVISERFEIRPKETQG